MTKSWNEVLDFKIFCLAGCNFQHHLYLTGHVVTGYRFQHSTKCHPMGWWFGQWVWWWRLTELGSCICITLWRWWPWQCCIGFSWNGRKTWHFQNKFTPWINWTCSIITLPGRWCPSGTWSAAVVARSSRSFPSFSVLHVSWPSHNESWRHKVVHKVLNKTRSLNLIFDKIEV